MAMSNRERQRRYRERARAALAKVQGADVSNEYPDKTVSNNTLVSLMAPFWRELVEEDDPEGEEHALAYAQIEPLLFNLCLTSPETDAEGCIVPNGKNFLSDEPRAQAIAELLGKDYVESLIAYENECRRIEIANKGKRKNKREPKPEIPPLPVSNEQQ